MKERNGLKVMLGIVGLLAWMAYILACRASWSPDGSKILFPYYNPEADEAGVALYDRNTGETRSIFVEADVDGPDDFYLLAQWEHDGARAILTLMGGGRDKLNVLLLPVRSEKPGQEFTLPKPEDSVLYLPLPEVAGNLYIGTEYLARLNLETGETEIRELEEGREVVLTGHSGRIFYHGPVLEQEERSEENRPEAASFEIGVLDPESLTFQPLFELRGGQLEANGIEEIIPFLALEPHGSRIAIVGKGEERDTILVCTKAGLQKVVVPELPVERYRLGNLQWAPDGKTIYAAVLTPTEEKGVEQYSVGEIPVDGRPAQLVPIARIHSDDLDTPIILQIALSPDGTTIATTTGYVAKKFIDREDRALYLVDVQDPGRKVTKVPLPPPQKAGASDEEE